jgi:ribosomal protein S18 acetylase RimI-like enzyme
LFCEYKRFFKGCSFITLKADFLEIFLSLGRQPAFMIIRKAKLDDIDSLIPIFIDYEKANVSYLTDWYRFMRDRKEPWMRYVKLAFKKDITKKNSLFLVAEEKGKLVGYIFGEIKHEKHPLFKKPKTGELNDIAVLKSYRGKGVSSKLWKELLAWFVKQKCEIVNLNVNVNNQAQEIYKHWGFDTFYLNMIKKL